MTENEAIWIWIWFIIWFLSWIVTGFIFWKIVDKKEIKYEKVVWTILCIIWVWAHLYWFYLDKSVPMLFDIVWASSTGMILWISISDNVLDAILKRWKK